MNEISELEQIKSRVIYCEDFEHMATKAWVRELRTFNKTKRIYAIDPYAEVYQFRENLYGIYTENADGRGDPWIYLIIGPKKALLIDNGFGIGDLRGLANMLAGEKEVVAAITHAHPDHAYGNCQFDKIYCHEYSRYRIEQQKNPHIWDYLFNEDGTCKWMQFDREDIVPYRDYEVEYCSDGYTFDLGDGYEVEMIHFPGHDAGHCGFLDKHNRIFFAGDNVITSCIGAGGKRKGDPYSEYTTLKSYSDGLDRVIARMDEFDTIFPSHFTVDLDKQVLLNIRETCDVVFENPRDYDFESVRPNGSISCSKYIWNLGVLCYGLEEFE